MALTGTADLKMGRKIRQLLSMTPDVHCIIQEAGRAGRNGKKADDITIYYGQQLATCEKAVKDFVKTDGCLRKGIFMPFDPDIESVTPMHECCSMCEEDCKCNGDGCSRIPQPFDRKDSDNSTTCTALFERNAYPADKEALRSALIGLKEQFDYLFIKSIESR